MSSFSVLILLVMCKEIFSSYYPNDILNPKPCTRLNNTVTYQGSICIPDCKGGFTKESITNCTNFLKECPEFNKASCEWYSLQFTNLIREIPCCRLKFKPNKKTWAEIYYTNQYGKWMKDNIEWNKKMGGNCGDLPINDVVEVHRKNINKAFQGRDVPDWPNSEMLSANSMADVVEQVLKNFKYQNMFEYTCAFF